MIQDGLIVTVTSVNSIEELQPYYPEMLLIERTGEEWAGWTYDGNNFHAPSNAILDNPTRITRLAFISRFTDAEAIGIDLASQGETISAATLRRALKKIDAANFIDLADQATIDGANGLEAFGLLAAGRANEIISTTLTEKELYKGSE